MKHSLRLFSAVALLMMGVVIASAQPRFEMKVTGTVMDSKTSEPLVAAVVKATSSNGGEGTFAITGEKGTFELTLSRPGKYTWNSPIWVIRPFRRIIISVLARRTTLAGSRWRKMPWR